MPTPSPNPEPTASKGDATEVHIQLSVCRLRRIRYGGCANAPSTSSLDSTYRLDSIGVAFALHCYRRVVKSARSVDIAKGGFVGQRLSGVDICSPLADLATARRPNHVSGRVHVWSAFNPRQWIKRRRTADRPVPLASSLCWRRDIVPMFPRLCRYEVRPLSEQPTCRLAHATPTCAVRPRTPSKLLRGFGCRCGACDVGYYGLSGECHECGNRILVLFLSHVVPALTILVATLFLFWGGKVDPQKANRSAAATSATSMFRHIVVWVSFSSCGKPTSCIGPISGHGELLVRVPCFVES